MQDQFVNSVETIALLYGDALYLVPDGLSNQVAAEPNLAAADVEVRSKEKITTPSASPENVPTSQPLPQEKVTPNEQSAPLSPETVAVPSAQKPGITWRTKPASKMLFILQQTEIKDPILAEFLKKIVESIGIPFDSAGFGIINGPVNLREFEGMPNRYGVVFDADLWNEPNVATTFGDREVFFAPRLAFLQDDADSKRQLWGYLKNLKEMLK